MYNYALDTSVFPQVWLTWATTKNKKFDKRYWLNCQTEELNDEPEDWMSVPKDREKISHSYGWNDMGGFGVTWRRVENGKLWIASNSSLQFAYGKYHPDIERFEIAVVKLDTKRHADTSRWQYAADRFFIGKDKTVVNQNGNSNLCDLYIDKQNKAWNPRYLISIVLRNNVNAKNFIDEFKKFLGEDSFLIGNGRRIAVNSVWSLEKWYKTVQKQPTVSKRQKEIDKLTEIPVSDCSCLKFKYPQKTHTDKYGYKSNIRHIAYFEQVNDEWSVLRYFYDRERESWRAYIHDNKKIYIVSPNDGKWTSMKQQKSHWNNYSYVANLDEAIAKCPRIKYIMQSLPDVEERDVLDHIITALRFPEIEQLIKMGCHDIATTAIKNAYTKATLKECFGGYYDDKGNNVLRKIGLTKKQLDVYLKHGNPQWELRHMRRLFGNDISYMDIESFDKYLSACNAIKNTSSWRNVLNSMDSPSFAIDEQVRIFKNLVRLSKKEPRIYQIVNDAMRSYEGLRNKPQIDWCFDDVSDAVRTHDAVIELKRVQDEEWNEMYRLQQAERLQKEDEKRKKIDAERIKYEYEDAEYIIRLPKDCNEIMTEGTSQKICIGGYTTSHSLGHTNIFLLRRKSEPDKPFYAIEMDNNKVIKQIHGFGNKWLGNDADAIPTVIRWLRKNGIQCSDQILTCKARGYGSINDYVPMPVVD